MPVQSCPEVREIAAAGLAKLSNIRAMRDSLLKVRQGPAGAAAEPVVGRDGAGRPGCGLHRVALREGWAGRARIGRARRGEEDL